MKLAFIGIGNVGFALANGLQRSGHEIIVAHQGPPSESVTTALTANPAFRAMPVQAAIEAAEAVFLAVPFGVCEALLASLDFGGKLLVDCTNPVGPGITHGLQSQVSGSEKIRQWAPSACVVKSFSIYGFENFRDSAYPAYPMRPVMLVAGDDDHAKRTLQPLVSDLGFEMMDTGPLSQALHLEHMTLLWVNMVRKNGHSPHFVWGLMVR